MAMVKKSITVTEHQNNWIKSQIATGNYGNESEVLRELIRARVIYDTEMEAIRSALIQGEQSGKSTKTVDEIWQQGEQHYKAKHG